jgi:hypothetical protein
MHRHLVLAFGVAFSAGVIVGGYLFADSQPRSFLALEHYWLKPTQSTNLRAPMTTTFCLGQSQCTTKLASRK